MWKTKTKKDLDEINFVDIKTIQLTVKINNTNYIKIITNL